MKLKLFLATAAAGIALAAAASAATLTATGGRSTTLTDPSHPACACLTPSIGDPVQVFYSATDGGSVSGGLSTSGNTGMKYSFVGKEAGAQNAVFSLNGSSITNHWSNVGSSFTVSQSGPGMVDFSFQTAERGGWEDLNNNSIYG